MRAVVHLVGVAVVMLNVASVHAASFQVSPVSLEVPAGSAAATISIANGGSQPLRVQFRAFRWVQADGEDKLSETDAVAVSPPVALVDPSADYTVRVVRTSRAAVKGVEAYRLLVDELPDRTAGRSLAVKLLVRYSIPLFFYPADSVEPHVAWSIEREGGQLFLAAVNQGDRQLRIANLKLSSGAHTASMSSGLLGYVLGRSKMRWPASSALVNFARDKRISLSAQTNIGSVHAEPSWAPAP